MLDSYANTLSLEDIQPMLVTEWVEVPMHKEPERRIGMEWTRSKVMNRIPLVERDVWVSVAEVTQ